MTMLRVSNKRQLAHLALVKTRTVIFQRHTKTRSICEQLKTSLEGQLNISPNVYNLCGMGMMPYDNSIQCYSESLESRVYGWQKLGAE